MVELKRNPTRSVRIGSITIGAEHPIAAQSMTATHTQDVAATVDRTNGIVKLYVNGTQDGSATYTKNAAIYEYNQMQWRIGIAQPGAGSYRWCADGWIDDARIYNKTLSDAEVAYLAAQ